MGINLGWIAVQSHLREDLLERLGLEPIGDVVHEVGQTYAMADTPEGWTVVTFRAPPSDMNETVAKGAPKGPSFHGFMSETVMASEVRGYEDGQFLWSVERYEHKGPGLIVQGEPPKILENIRHRREAEQGKSDAEDVDFLFEAPLDLGAALTGYRPGQGELEWQVLGRKGRTATKGKQNSLRAAIKAELLPLLWSLDWQADDDKPQIADAGQIVRQVGPQKQTLWLDFASGPKTYIAVYFGTQEPLPSGANWHVYGLAQDPPVRVPLWKRLTWSHLRGPTHPAQELDNPIQAAIDKAKSDILAIDTFLKGGEQSAPVVIRSAREIRDKH